MIRTAIARALSGRSDVPRLGEITLMPHQEEAVERLRVHLAQQGGVLLADDVGLGKTFVALAVAREYARPLVLGPAALRETWRTSLHRTRQHMPFLSYEALSRGTRPDGTHDLVILDEAHHARNPRTRRYEGIIALTRCARVLLLSATPLHNTPDDVRALLALFLGRAAHLIPAASLGEHIVRRARTDVSASIQVPSLRTHDWIQVAEDERVLRAIIGLPPPVPPSDGHVPGALLTLTLIRLWASSRAALRGALRRRLQRALAMEQALENGRNPTAAELRMWRGDEHAVQLAFPTLLVEGEVRAEEADMLLRAMHAHAAAVRRLLRGIAADDGPDLARAEHLRQIRARHRDQRIIGFTMFSETAECMYRLLRHEERVCVLNASAARVAGGSLSRREALAAFAPGATHQSRAAEHIDLLITTDLASEGVNLQEASVVVHLDLPWTAARMEQRIGRVRRLGSRHPITWSYAYAPPAAADTMLAVERLLRRKFESSRELLGAETSLLPGRLDAQPEPFTQARERLLRIVRSWGADASGRATPPLGTPIVAAVQATSSGWIALLAGRSGHHLLGGSGNRVDDDPGLLATLAEGATDADVHHSRRAVMHALRQIGRWEQRRQARQVSGMHQEEMLRVRASLLQRISATVSRAPLSRRGRMLELAARARRVALRRLSLADERDLLMLGKLVLPDDAWLERLAGWHVEEDAIGGGRDGPALSLVALLILRRDG